jgi:hypothetical protein
MNKILPFFIVSLILNYKLVRLDGCLLFHTLKVCNCQNVLYKEFGNSCASASKCRGKQRRYYRAGLLGQQPYTAGLLGQQPYTAGLLGQQAHVH